VAIASRGHERRRGIDRCDRLCAQPLGEDGRQRAGTASDVERALAPRNVGEVGEFRREWR
jgi:hypothetical protein